MGWEQKYRRIRSYMRWVWCGRKYWTASGEFNFFLKIALLSLLLVAACFAIIKAEDGMAAAKASVVKKRWLYALVLSMSYLLMFNPMDALNTELQKFSRVMGAGVKDGYDVTRVIGNFTKWILGAVFLFILMLLLVSYIRSREYSDEQKKAWQFLDNFMVLAGVNLLLRCITYFYDGIHLGKPFHYSTGMVMVAGITTVIYIVGRLDRQIKFNSFQSVMVFMFAVSFPLAVLIRSGWEDGFLLMGVQGILMLGSCAALKWERLTEALCRDRFALWAGTAAASLFPLTLSLYIELVNILAGRGIFVVRLRHWYIISVAMLYVGGFALYAAAKKIKKALPDEKSIAYPVLVIGVGMLLQQIPLTGVYNADMYEGANAGILISDFLNFGVIPIVGHYGGHMMTGVWEGILYGIVNNDVVGAAFSPYSGLIAPVLAVAFYYTVKNLWDEGAAFWTTLLFPFYNAWSYFGLGMLVALAVVSFVRKNSYFRAALVWFTCVWVTLYRLDMGYAFDIACVAALVCYIVRKRKWTAVKPLAVTFGVYVFVFGGLWCVLCIAKGINPAVRLFEFIKVSGSNLNWAYNNIGNPINTVYSWCYLIIPLSVALTFFYAVVSRGFMEKAGLVRWLILIIVGTSYFANFSRGLVRHSLVEGALAVVLWSACLYLAVFVSCCLKKEYFLPVFTAFVLFNTLLVQGANFSEACILDNAVRKMTSFVDSWELARFDYEDYGKTGGDSDEYPMTYWEELKDKGEKVERVVIDGELAERVLPLRQLVGLLLEDNETYMDFMNWTMAYCLVQKENPVYISQSPLQLSGEFTQECFVEEVRKGNVPLAVLPFYNNNSYLSDSLDGIANTYRYYKVAEYIWQNYIPLCRNGGYAVWCLPERHDEMKAKLGAGSEECVGKFANDEIPYQVKNMDVRADGSSLVLTYTGNDAIFYDINKYLDLSAYAGGERALYNGLCRE